jgi:hypothetical protein
VDRAEFDAAGDEAAEEAGRAKRTARGGDDVAPPGGDDEGTDPRTGDS